MAIHPAGRPRQAEDVTRAELVRGGVHTQTALLGVRGYYRDSMGKKGKNDRGIYDDALFLVGPGGHWTFNANTDPSKHAHGIAVLKPGLWLYKIGIHGLSKPRHPSGTLEYTDASYQYAALVQAQKVVVVRDGKGEDAGWFGINIHRGSTTTTSSLGCQTIRPTQWAEFLMLVRRELAAAKQVTLPYLLVARDEVK